MGRSFRKDSEFNRRDDRRDSRREERRKKLKSRIEAYSSSYGLKYDNGGESYDYRRESSRNY
jgi:hypothetical protein